MTGDYRGRRVRLRPRAHRAVLPPLVRPLTAGTGGPSGWAWRTSPPRARAAGGNHAGTIPVDALVMKFGLFDEHPAHRHLRLLAADLAFRMPLSGRWPGRWATRSPATRTRPACSRPASWSACSRRATRASARGGGTATGCSGSAGEGSSRSRCARGSHRSGGDRGVRGDLSDDRQRAPLARLSGLPYFPITPAFPWLGPLGAIPLPSKWIVEFGEPIPTEVLRGRRVAGRHAAVRADRPDPGHHPADAVPEPDRAAHAVLLTTAGHGVTDGPDVGVRGVRSEAAGSARRTASGPRRPPR